MRYILYLPQNIPTNSKASDDKSSAKFNQNESLRNKLLETKEAYLVECTHADTIWACGKHIDEPDRLDADKWNGQNILGFSLRNCAKINQSYKGEMVIIESIPNSV